MANLKKALLTGATLLAASISGQAYALKISGINLGAGDSGNTSLQDVSAETIVTQQGDVLQGVGRITSINGNFNFADAGLELNFVYTAHVDFDNGSTIIFDTGALTFYVNPLGTFDISPTSPYGTLALQQGAIASTGTEFLNLVTTTVTTIAPYNVLGAPATGGFFGTGTDLSGTNPSGSGVGYMAVDLTGAGTANTALDTDTLLFNGTTPYDMLFTSTFSVPAANTYADWVEVQDASTFTGAYRAVPEPSTLALFGIALGGFGLRKRKLNTAARKAAA